jgi:hypothetical protein
MIHAMPDFAVLDPAIPRFTDAEVAGQRHQLDRLPVTRRAVLDLPS